MTFTAGWNMPGYLPEGDPEEFNTFAEALTHVRESLDRFWDEDYAGRTGSKERIEADGKWLPVHTAIHVASEIDGAWSQVAGDGSLVFWIQPTV